METLNNQLAVFAILKLDGLQNSIIYIETSSDYKEKTERK